MLTAWVAIPVGLTIWLCCVFALATAISVVGLVVARLVWAIATLQPKEITGALIGALVWGTLSVVLGIGSLNLGAYVFEGIVGRLL